MIDADSDDVAAAIAFIAVLGVGVVLGLPLLGIGLHLSELQYGAFAGLTFYAVPQVIAAAAPVVLSLLVLGAISLALVATLHLG